jgi:kynureninase
MIASAAVIPDYRGPDSIRLGVAPLYTGFTDVWDALDRVRGLVERGEHTAFDTAPGRVT